MLCSRKKSQADSSRGIDLAFAFHESNQVWKSVTLTPSNTGCFLKLAIIAFTTRGLLDVKAGPDAEGAAGVAGIAADLTAGEVAAGLYTAGAGDRAGAGSE